MKESGKEHWLVVDVWASYGRKYASWKKSGFDTYTISTIKNKKKTNTFATFAGRRFKVDSTSFCNGVLSVNARSSGILARDRLGKRSGGNCQEITCPNDFFQRGRRGKNGIRGLLFFPYLPR